MATKTRKNKRSKLKVSAPKMNLDMPKVDMNIIKKSVVSVNDFVYETSEDAVDAALVGASQWQEIGEKAIKGGLKLAEKQQDLVFTALETVKKSVFGKNSRAQQFFSKN